METTEVTVAPVSEAQSMLNAIERAALNPAVDTEKMERLLAMQERIVARQAEAAFNIAMNACQTDMGQIAADATNPQTRSRYASYGKLDSKLRPIYTRHGFSLSFDEGDSPKAEHVRVLCYVSHNQGHTRTYRADIPADGKGAKGGDVMTKTHAVGAAKSYGKRYLLKDIFNMAIGEEDTDGNDPVGLPTLSERQIADLECIITEHGGNLDKLLKHWKITSLSQILAKNYDAAVAEVKALAKARQERRARGPQS